MAENIVSITRTHTVSKALLYTVKPPCYQMSDCFVRLLSSRSSRMWDWRLGLYSIFFSALLFLSLYIQMACHLTSIYPKIVGTRQCKKSCPILTMSSSPCWKYLKRQIHWSQLLARRLAFVFFAFIVVHDLPVWSAYRCKQHSNALPELYRPSWYNLLVGMLSTAPRTPWSQLVVIKGPHPSPQLASSLRPNPASQSIQTCEASYGNHARASQSHQGIERSLQYLVTHGKGRSNIYGDVQQEYPDHIYS